MLPLGKTLHGFLFVFAVLFASSAVAQQQNLSFCFQAGQPFGPNDNVFVAAGVVWTPGTQFFTGQVPCLSIEANGSFHWTTDNSEACCGTYYIDYFIGGSAQGTGPVMGIIEIIIKCPKPNCNLIDLNDLLSGSDPAGTGGNPTGEPECVHVCEFSEVTFFVDYNANNNYAWTVLSGGTGVTGANDAEYIVTWGAQGQGFLQLDITDANGNTTTYVFCIDILPAPVAGFTTTGYACLGQSMCFTNTSTPSGVTSFWDFGDGNTSNAWSPCHTYLTPGTYTVTLTVTNQNSDAQGNPLCCCTDVIEMEVVVDELPGPSIFCISTLCQGDSDCYSTDATNCSSYIWTVLDADGNDITGTITGQGTNSICVTWPIGPFGTITLDVAGCDSTYCPNPTTVTVPVISNTSDVDGPIVVCAFSTETYSVPKWYGTTYSWTVTGGSVPPGGGTGNIDNITWGGPGVGTITVNYVSTFLGGLPGQDPVNCEGTATLTVLIKPEFSVTNSGPSNVCLGSTSSVSATASPDPSYNWTITPPHPFSGQGTSNISIVWTAPGAYIISANNSSGTYCNTDESTVIIVQNVPAPLGITGPLTICPTATEYYTVTPSGPGYNYQWSVSNGSLSSNSGATVGVTWGPGGGTLTVQQVMTGIPFCASQPYTITVTQKGPNGPYTAGASSACLNSLDNYTFSPSPHPDAVVTWSLSNPSLGSILNAGANSAQVQWGNTAGGVTLIANVELCGQTVQVPFNLNLIAPQVPVISQTGTLCQLGGGSATLTASGGCFTSYSWSNGGNMASTSISSGGTYTLTTVDCNGCVATATFNTIVNPAPTSLISSPDGNTICINNPHNVQMFAGTNGSYQLTWSCSFNGGPAVVVQGPSTSATYTHTFQNQLGTYAYTLFIMDPVTGCTNTWGTFYVYEDDCPILPPCVPEDHFLAGFATQVGPFCDTYQFNYNASPNFTLTSWTFGDGFGSGAASPTHTYGNIGYYTARVCGTVPEAGVPGNFCSVCRDVPIVVPVKAKFSSAITTCLTYAFTDLSTFLAGPGNNIVNWTWTSTDGHFFSSGTPTGPTWVFSGPGSFTVTLLVTTANGCQSQYQQVINVIGIAPPVISPAVSSVCEDDVIPFSVSAPGATSFVWAFGDGGTFSGQNVNWAYNNPSYPGTFNLSVTVSNALGCTATVSQPIMVHPKPAGGDISGNLAVCMGDVTTLTANVNPANGDGPYTYLWTPGGMLTQSVTVGSGTYSVTVTNVFGCSIDLDPVTVVDLPLPNATISGNLFICDAGCTTLTAPYDPNNQYQWFDALGNALPGEISNQISVCDWNLLSGYYVQVTDQNGCQNISATVIVQMAVSPSFTVLVNPTPACAGSPTTLTVSPIDPSVNYVWSTGANATSITVYQAGFYTVTGTDPVTGCSSSASATVNPLPDLCIVPQGCYEVCNPDTICAPPGLTYQWYLDNVPFSTDQCIIVTQSGTYSLTATNGFGCSATSGDLVLTVVPCPEGPCEDLFIEYTPVYNEIDIPDPCCVNVSYTNNNPDPVKGISIWTNDGDLAFSNIDLALNTQSVTSNSIALGGNPVGSPLPTGTLASFITICVQNATTSPQVIYFDWIDFENQVICTDSLIIDCPVEPPCIYVVDDHIDCEDQGIFYTFTVCNPISSPISIGIINFVNILPAGLVINPAFIDVTGSPILPGTCQTFTVELTGSGIEGQTFCYELVGHEGNPDENPGVICCSTGIQYCIDIPICDPCPLVGIEGWNPNDSADGCCFDVFLYNNFGPGYFDEIGVNVISPATTLTVNNPFGSGWLTSGLTPTSVSFLPDPIGSGVPGGAFSIPTLCLQTNIPPFQQIEITWNKDGEVICRDTLSVFCEPPCGYIPNESIVCDPATGNWNYSGQIKNTSGQMVNQAYIEFTTPGMSIYNQTVPLGNTLPGQLSNLFNLLIGAPAAAGDVICFTVTLHQVTSDGEILTCCVFEHCFTLPECEQVIPCVCGPEFIANVNAGFTATQSSTNPFAYTFQMVNFDWFGPCDQFIWLWGYTTPSTATSGPTSVTHVFPGPGTYTVCVRVTRTLPDGSQCKHIKCIPLVVTGLPGMAPPDPAAMSIFPNPTKGQFALKMYEDVTYPVSFTVMDFSGRTIAAYEQKAKPDDNIISFDLGTQPAGIYMLHFNIGQDTHSRKVIIE